jgi:SAM-dependent methyltransferase
VHEGTAESIPLPDGSVDAVTVAQAFHWFDAEAALAEIHRVLRPGGGLGLIWNMMDVGVEWVAVLQELVRGARGSVPAYGPSPWRDAFGSSRLFTPLTERTFAFVPALPDAERQRLVGQVRTLVAGMPRPIRLPYRTDVFCCRGT